MTLRRSITLATLQAYARYVVMFASTIVVARLLSPGEIGVFAISMGIISMLDAIRSVSTAPYFTALAEVTTEDLRLYAGMNWVLGLCFAALMVALSWPAAAIYGNPGIGASLRILAFAQAVSPFGAVANLILLREMRFGSMLWIGLAASLTQMAVTVGLAMAGAGALSLAWAQVASNLVMSLGAAACQRETLWLVPTWRNWRRPLGFGSWMTGTVISGSIGMQAAELITGRILGLAATAQYARALGLSALVRSMFLSAATQPALPAFARADREEEGGIARIYLRFVAVITGLSWPAYAALAIWAEPITVLLYGETWRPSAALLPVICIGNMLACAAQPYNQVLVARQRVRLLFLCETALLFTWLTLLLLTARLGLQAVAWAYVCGSAIAVIAYLIVLRRVIGLRARAIVAAWWRSAVPAGAVALAACAVRVSPFGTALPVPVALAVTACLGGLAWLASIWLVRHEFRGHASDLLAAGRQRLAGR